MGVSIAIGNVTAELDEEGYFSHTVPDLKREEGVDFALGLRKTNRTTETYRLWQDFCIEVGIDELFFYRLEGGGYEYFNYPGVLGITEDVLGKLKNALSDYQKRYPDIDIKDEVTSDDVKTYLYLLNWLVYWSERAFKNDERPGIKLS